MSIINRIILSVHLCVCLSWFLSGLYLFNGFEAFATKNGVMVAIVSWSDKKRFELLSSSSRLEKNKDIISAGYDWQIQPFAVKKNLTRSKEPCLKEACVARNNNQLESSNMSEL